MFHNVGEKIQRISKIFFWLGTIFLSLGIFSTLLWFAEKLDINKAKSFMIALLFSSFIMFVLWLICLVFVGMGQQMSDMECTAEFAESSAQSLKTIVMQLQEIEKMIPHTKEIGKRYLDQIESLYREGRLSPEEYDALIRGEKRYLKTLEKDTDFLLDVPSPQKAPSKPVCSACGKQLEGHETFCTGCGKRQ